MIRIAAMCKILPSQLRANRRSRTRGRPQLNVAVKLARPSAHSHQTKSGNLAVGDGRQVEADPVVLHLDDNPGALRHNPHGHVSGLAMLGHVGERFLNDPEDSQLHRHRQP
jgi:hypothetical protein